MGLLSMGIQSRLHRATPARKRKRTRVIGRRRSNQIEDEAAEEVINRATSNIDNYTYLPN
jgi:hypothetical protein